MKLKKAIAIFLGITLSYPTLPVLEKTKIIAEENNVQRLEKDSIKEMETAEEKAVTDFSQYEENELLVLYKDGTSKKEKKKIVNEIETTMQERETITDWCDKITLENEKDLKTTVESIAKDEDVLYVQPNFRYSAMGTMSSPIDITTVTESDFSKQWWIYNDGSFEEPENVDYDSFWPPYSFWPFASSKSQTIFSEDSIWDSFFETKVNAMAGIDTNTAKAWQEFTTGGRKTVIAIIDTGIDHTHSQLKNSIWTNSSEIPGNGIDDDGNGYIDDVYGWNFYYDSNETYVGTSKIRGGIENEDEHGTHVAGIIAAARDGVGTAGIASNTNVELMCLKVLGGKEGSGETVDIVKAIEYAEKQGAVICNMSFGINQTDIPFYYQDYDKAMKEAVEKSSMLFVTASGNEGSNNDTYGVYPSSYDFDNIISVGNLRCDGTLSAYSNYGEISVDLAAPGMYIYSTIPNEKYDYMSGTSMAAPMVTAACAMGYAYAKIPDIFAVRERLLANITKNSSLDKKVSTSGMLNVYDTVKDLAEHEYTYKREDTFTENESSKNEENSENGNNANETISDNVEDNNDISSSIEDTKNDSSNIDVMPEKPSNQVNPNDTNTGQEVSKNMIGTKFIQDGIIYKIVSSSTVEAIGAEDSTAKKLVIKANVVYQSKSYKVVKIKEKAFYKNQSVKQVTIGKNVKVIGKSAFIGCKKLQKVTGMAAVEKIQKNAFKNCKKLQSIRLTENVNTIASSAFQGCNKLKVKVVRGSYAADFIKTKKISVNYF